MSMILIVHIGGSGLALLAGGAVLALKKGARLHRYLGRVFLVSMLIMAVSAIPLAYSAGKTLDVLSGMLVCYLVLSSWLTLKEGYRPLKVGVFGLGWLVLLGYLWVEWVGSKTGVRRPDVPASAGLVFAVVTALSLAGDVVKNVKGGYPYYRPVLRHLWRMCFAFLLAAVSFFLSRAQLFPEVVRDSGLLYLLALAPLIAMLFWWTRIRLIQYRR